MNNQCFDGLIFPTECQILPVQVKKD